MMIPPDSRGTNQPSAAAPVLRVLPLTAIQWAAQNPRTDAAADLDELTASIAAVHEPYLAQLPLVHEEEAGTFRVIAGERRIRAVMAAGWQTVACLVYRRLDAATALTRPHIQPSPPVNVYRVLEASDDPDAPVLGCSRWVTMGSWRFVRTPGLLRCPTVSPAGLMHDLLSINMCGMPIRSYPCEIAISDLTRPVSVSRVTGGASTSTAGTRFGAASRSNP